MERPGETTDVSHVPPGRDDVHALAAAPQLTAGPLAEPVIAVDAMGGDYAPDEIVAGALAAQREHGLTTLLTGPPARLRFLALRPISVNLKMRLTYGPMAVAFPIDFFVTDAQGHAFQGEIQTKNPEPMRLNLPKGLSYLELSVKAKGSDPHAGQSLFPILAQLDGIEISDVGLNPE